MRRAFALLSIVGVAALLGVLVPSAGAAPASRGVTIGTFSDSVGEVAGAPDITTVTVSLEGDVLSIQGQVTGMPALLSEDGSFMFLLNTDSNATTGKLGADYVLIADTKALSMAFMKWDGSDYVPAPKAADPTRMLLGSTSAGFMFHLANFGSPTHIEFALIVVKGQPEGGLLDTAPNSGLWAFDTVAPTPAPAPAPVPAPAPKPAAVVKPMIGAAVATPKALIAGKRTTVAFRVRRSDNGQPLTSGRMICDPSVAGKMIAHTESFKGGIARLSFLVPKTAAGKLLRVKVTIKAGGQSATKIVSFRVR